MKRFLIYYFLLLSSIFIFLSSGSIDSQDGLQYLAVARNIYYKGEPTAPVYEFNIAKNTHMSTYIGKDGKTYSPTGLGFSLAFLPAVVITDIVYKFYNIPPPVHFPLESDWLIFLLASLTNSFFAALLGIILFKYFITLKIKFKQALLLSALSLFTTNLFVYGKHSMAHMMFITFLLLTFFGIKKYFITKSKKTLFLAGLSYGAVIITYNLTFILTLPPLIIYGLILSKAKINSNTILRFIKKFFIFFLGIFPFLIMYFWFESLRSGTSFTNATYLTSYAKATVSRLPIPILIDGLFGQLFSPGRSIFLYSPLLLIILFFWRKIPSSIKPELFTFLAFTLIYILFFAAQYATGRPDQSIAELWHGESSWGPRYLTPLIPFGMLIVGSIFIALSKREKLFIFLPLAIFGFYVEILGVFMPYQIKYHNLETRFFINGIEYPASIYSNFLPRFSPIYIMSKNLIFTAKAFPQTLDHGIYNVKFYDGIDFPFNVGPERWRTLNENSYISFDNNQKNSVQKMSFGIINHPIGNSSSSAFLQFSLNNHLLSAEPIKLSLKERRFLELPIKQNYLKLTNNQLVVNVRYDDPEVAKNHSQILGWINFFINDTPINMESIDVPYVSPLGPKMTGISYKNFGGTNQDPWLTWQIHTQIFERVPDFWWIKALYYWDFPKLLFLLMFLINICGLLFFSQKIYLILKKFK